MLRVPDRGEPLETERIAAHLRRHGSNRLQKFWRTEEKKEGQYDELSFAGEGISFRLSLAR
jgi:hypothetical protein